LANKELVAVPKKKVNQNHIANAEKVLKLGTPKILPKEKCPLPIGQIVKNGDLNG
jgi:hypothetical protein